MITSENKNNSVLIVDDDEIILIALIETMQSEGYHIVKANTPLDAIEKLKKEKFAVIISDQRMAGMTGLEFFMEAKKIQPYASRVLITGVLSLNTVIDSINRGEIYRFIAKPWIREELLATVKNGIHRFHLLELNIKLQADTLKLNDSLDHANRELQSKVHELTEQKVKLDEAHDALTHNFKHSLELCYRIISTYHPGLGKETKAIVELCHLFTDTGYLTEEEEQVLKVSAWLQNIGLIGISRELFYKARISPNALTQRERLFIHNHPVYGQMLATFLNDLKKVGSTIRAHDERWDGKGYPDGLAGENIPCTARLLAVIVYYVECGLPREEAIDNILNESGNAFEPSAVRLF